MTAYRITAVCLGNICRSPMAEAVLRSRVAAAGLAAVVTVDSAGTAGWNEGGDADPRARAALGRAGYGLHHRARQFRREWFASTDLVLAMDQSNQSDLLRLGRGLPDCAQRIRMLRSFDPAAASLDVPDPYRGSDEGFTDVLAMIESAVDGVMAHVDAALSGHCAV